MLKLNEIYNMDCIQGMSLLDDESVDLTVTSPPYDTLRTYEGYTFDYKKTADELYRVTKKGGVVVWIVGDATNAGSESLTSFQQALYFRSIGFCVETMIWEKPTFTATGALRYRYGQVFEYMFVFSKGYPGHFHPIMDRPNKYCGTPRHGTVRQKDGSTKAHSSQGTLIPAYGQRFNVWRIAPETSNSKRCHPAQFPEQLAYDHIISWSNQGDTVLDPFIGGGTTAVSAIRAGRNYIGFEVSRSYCDIAEKRIQQMEKPNANKEARRIAE